VKENAMLDLTTEKITDICEWSESEAWANFYQCAPLEFVKKYRLEAQRVGSVWVTLIAELDWTFFNRIVGLGIGQPASQTMLDDAIAILQNAGCKNYMAQLSPLAQPSQLPEWLERRGFVRKSNWAKVYRGDEPVPIAPTDLRVERIGKKQAPTFAEVALTAFEMPFELSPFMIGNVEKPGWQHYLAFDGEQAVSAAAMFVSGEVAWLGYGSTLPTHRRRGGQSALFALRIQDGLKLGCKAFVTETGEDSPEHPNPSYHNMLHSGFKLAYLRPNYHYQSK
jgi:hypothetical protein